MTVTTDNNPLNKILSVIKRKGTARLSDIKRSIVEFNQGGGVEKLRKHLADLVANGKSFSFRNYSNTSP